MESIYKYIALNGKKYRIDEYESWCYALSSDEENEKLRQFFKEWADERDFILGKTSGSTGDPKTIKLSKRAMLASAELTNSFFNLKAGDSILLCLSVNYIAGKMMLVRAIAGGLNVVVAKPSSEPDWKGSVALAAMVPMQVQQLLSSAKGRKALSMVENLIVGGSPLSRDCAEKLSDLPVNAYMTYGMTETVSHVALSKIGRETRPVYTAMSGVRFSLDNRGCLVISAPHLSEENVVTNDVAELISDMSFVWKGRFDNVINTGGVKVHPEVVEDSLRGMIDRRFYVMAEPDDKFGEIVVLKIEGMPLSDNLLAKLQSDMALHLSKFERPKKILFLAKFRETDSGKVIRI